MKTEDIINKLREINIKILSLSDLKKLFNIAKDNTAYKTAGKLVKKRFLIRLMKGCYASTFNLPEEYEIGNSLYSPSYISLETALNYYGILSQFPYAIASVTTKKAKKIKANSKEYDYAHINKNLFWGYKKENGLLIATPEKALVDLIYFACKGWRAIDINELDITSLNRKILKKMASKIKYRLFQKKWKELAL